MAVINPYRYRTVNYKWVWLQCCSMAQQIDATFKIGYINCSACDNSQHKKYNQCKDCGAQF